MKEIVHDGSTSPLKIRVGFYKSYKMEKRFLWWKHTPFEN
jgi:hypothetical protein